jgi:hypothetical protein
MTTIPFPSPAGVRASGSPGRTLTHGQIGCVLNDIAQSAMQIDALIVRLQGADEDPNLVDALTGAVAALAQRIGWAADMAAIQIPGSGGAAFGGAERWMMPPSFHWEDERAAAAGGDDHG